MLFCHISSHVEADPHQNLLEEKGGPGWPYLVFMDAEGNLIAQHQSAHTVAALQTSLAAVQKVGELTAKAEAGDEPAKVELFLAQLQLGSVGFAEAKARLTELEKLPAFAKAVDSAKRAELDQTFVNLEADAIIKELQSKGPDPSGLDGAAERMAEMRKAGRIPTGQSGMYFWNVQLSVAMRKKDTDSAKAIVGAWKQTLKQDDPQEAQISKQLDGLLERLEKEAKPAPTDGKDGEGK